MTKAFEAAIASSTSTPSPATAPSADDVTPKPPEKAPPTARHKLATPSCAALTLNDAAPGGGAVSLAEEKSVTSLDDEGLRALLDEAINYKRPKDREGKSKLFNSLLSDAEDEIRKKHAYNASGPARHFNTTAKRQQQQQQQQRHRQQRRPQPPSATSSMCAASSPSVAEHGTHGGSLNDLVKQALYESSKMQRPTKTVSARQREGGSLPCNVNADIDKQYFIDERRLQLQQPHQPPPHRRLEWANASADSVSLHADAAADDDDDGEMKMRPRVPQVFSSKATAPSKVDDGVVFPAMQPQPIYELADGAARQVSPTAVGRNLLNRTGAHLVRPERKLDENGNALAALGNASAVSLIAGGGGGSAALDAKRQKKRKKKHDEDVIIAYQIEGHRADIIDDIDSLVSFIDGTEDKGKPRRPLHRQQQQVPPTVQADAEKGRKRARKKATSMLAKANSLEELSARKLADFGCAFDALDAAGAEKAALRPTKSNAEQMPPESVEIADFIFVTKKKKSRKRRSSLGSRANGRPAHCEPQRPAEYHGVSLRARSPGPAPSDKSNDSSDDNASVKSMPAHADAAKMPTASYADIAKSSDRPKWNRPPSERRKQALPAAVTAPAAEEAPDGGREPPHTDFSSLHSWPEIRNHRANVGKLKEGAAGAAGQEWPPIAAAAAAAKVQKVPAAPAAVAGNQNASGGQGGALEAHKNIANAASAKASKLAMNSTVVAAVKEQMDELKSGDPEEVQPGGPDPDASPTCKCAPCELAPSDPVASNPQESLQQVPEPPACPAYQYKLPANIRDVQSIEQMQMRSLHAVDVDGEARDSSSSSIAATANGSRATEKPRPAVVILSNRNEKHVVDITFGFDINEQLLSGDVCADFVSRFILPDVPLAAHAHIDKLVNYIGSEWHEVMLQTQSGRVKYFSDDAPS